MDILYADELLRSAREQTGLSDFGPDDFREGFDSLIHGLNTDVNVLDDRVVPLRQNLLRLLINRLWFHKDLRDHPEILEEQIKAPVIISSLPRTGSTKLHRLLGASGDFQVMEYWKGHMFARIPGEPDGGRERRIAETRSYEKWLSIVSPDMITGHPVFTEEPEEDMQLLAYSFRTISCGIFGSPSYFAWLLSADETPAYDYMKMQLQYLQWQFSEQRDKPWLLKTPVHFGSEAQLCRIFDKPRFLVTHRDPAKIVPSAASMSHNWHVVYSNPVVNADTGADTTEFLADFAERHVAWRAASPAEHILDIGFCDVTDNEDFLVAKIYQELGLCLSTQSEAAMAAWSERNPRGKHGSHSYTAQKFGTTDERIRARFKTYIDRFEGLMGFNGKDS